MSTSEKGGLDDWQTRRAISGSLEIAQSAVAIAAAVDSSNSPRADAYYEAQTAINKALMLLDGREPVVGGPGGGT